MQQIRVENSSYTSSLFVIFTFPFTSQQTWHNNNIEGKKKKKLSTETKPQKSPKTRRCEAGNNSTNRLESKTRFQITTKKKKQKNEQK
jgi:hypothetical protein